MHLLWICKSGKGSQSNFLFVFQAGDGYLAGLAARFSSELNFDEDDVLHQLEDLRSAATSDCHFFPRSRRLSETETHNYANFPDDKNFSPGIYAVSFKFSRLFCAFFFYFSASNSSYFPKKSLWRNSEKKWNLFTPQFWSSQYFRGLSRVFQGQIFYSSKARNHSWDASKRFIGLPIESRPESFSMNFRFFSDKECQIDPISDQFSVFCLHLEHKHARDFT